MMVPIGDSGLPLTISLESSKPLYEQIESQVRQLILTGMIEAGTTLPSVRALASQVGCSVITTRRAYQDLEQKGLIHTFPGRGTIVADVPIDSREKQRKMPVVNALREAHRLATDAGMDETDLAALFQDIMAEGDNER